MPQDAAQNPEEQAARMHERKMTDIPCCIVFISYMVGMALIIAHSVREGNIKRLTHGFNFHGELCGVDPNVSAKPYLYWCGGDQPPINGIPVNLNLKSPVCVNACPLGPQSPAIYCPMPSETTVTQTGLAPSLTVTTLIVSRVVPQTPYKTNLLGSLYCIPDFSVAPALGASLFQGAKAPLASGKKQALELMGSIKRAWRVFCGTVVVAILLSYMYLYLLNKVAKVIVYVSLAFLTISQILVGLALICTAYNLTGHQADSPIFKRYPHSQAVQYSLWSGIIILALGIIALCVILCAKSAIATACDCVKAACECMFDMPSLLLQPLAAALAKMAVALVLIVGFMYLLSCGKVKGESTTIGGAKVSGLKRSFSFTREQHYMFVYYIFGYFWAMEFCNAVNLFVTSYAVTLWFYKPSQGLKKMAPRMAVIRGFATAITFHLGSLAFGALIVAICQIVKLVLGLVSQSAKKENPVAAAIAGCLACCVSCFEGFLKFITKNAYIDIAIKSDNFCEAAKNSFSFIMKEGTVVFILNGACYVIQVVGMITVAAGGGMSTYALTTKFDRYTSDTSPHYVSDPTGVAILAALLSLGIGIAFMHIFDQCADTLLYLYQALKDGDAESGKSSVHEFAPASLVALDRGSDDERQPLTASPRGSGRPGE